MPIPTLILWDIDGTLLRTNGAGVRAMHRVAARMFGHELSWDGIEMAGHLDPLIFAEVASRNGLADAHLHHQRFHDHYLDALAAELHRVGPEARPMPGILDLLHRLRRRQTGVGDVVQGLLTGNYTRAAPLKLRAVGIDPDWFSIAAMGDDGPTRPDLVLVAMRRYREQLGMEAEARRVIVIGDTPRDVACAKAHACLAFGVGTGRYTAEQLLQAGADAAAGDLADPAPLLTLIDSTRG
jgi:phosphoglycolate phosphatase